jgi:hypothetical protein
MHYQRLWQAERRGEQVEWPVRLTPHPPTPCNVSGCARTARSSRTQFCNLHYRRWRRTGDPLSVQRRMGSPWVDRNGYRMVTAKGHPLATERGALYEHRAVLYEAIGPGVHACHWCGRSVSWDLSFPSSLDALVVDHVDGGKLHNDPSNLVPSCHACNTTRSLGSQASACA